MGLNKPEQDLKRDLHGIASDLKWSAVELKRIAEQLTLAGNENDAQAIHHLITIFKADESRLNARAAEISAQASEQIA
ncbi:hypothetical protein [Pseudomonas lundensis]|uniref:hypothetical protein n=1 Tax=Pseudomonas lundensis TaxID=86185 RepID=UPI00089DBB24|nr:hypothetical protein [Pseudomonas lundensis]